MFTRSNVIGHATVISAEVMTVDREALLHRMKEMQEADARRLAELGFDWRDCPQCKQPPSAENPLAAQPGVLQLDDGRAARMSECHQYAVYGGALAGIPPAPSLFLTQAVQRAETLFSDIGKPKVLAPEIRQGTLVSGSREIHWALLPNVCTIALLVSNSPARQPVAHASMLIAVWFQDEFGALTDFRTRGQLTGLDWKQCAVDVER